LYIVSSILFPVFARAREKARQASCLSNVKQMAVAWIAYSTDYDEMTCLWYYRSGTAQWGPGTNPNNGWCCILYNVLLDPYVKNFQAWACPSRTGTYSGKAQVGGCTPHYGYGCGFAKAWRPSAPRFCDPAFQSIAGVPRPAETVVLAESANRGTPTCGLGRSGPGACDSCAWGGCDLYYNSNPHNGGRNIVLADGHAKWYMKGRDSRRELVW
jgi:prepilin-type processing-associated H-X9-DG protein